MSKDKKIRMPQSGGGLTSFYDESTSRITISPKVVIAITLIVILGTILLNVI